MRSDSNYLKILMEGKPSRLLQIIERAGACTD
jgi:hypothetical protein